MTILYAAVMNSRLGHIVRDMFLALLITVAWGAQCTALAMGLWLWVGPVLGLAAGLLDIFVSLVAFAYLTDY